MMKNLMKEIKTGFKLMKYTISAKSYIAGAVIMIIVSAFLEIMSVVSGRPQVGMYGAYFFVLSTMWIVQMMYSFSFSSLVMSSAAHYKLQVKIPVELTAIANLAAYTICVLLEGILVALGLRMNALACLYIIFAAVCTFLFSVYVNASLKRYILATIIFVIPVCALISWFPNTLIESAKTNGFPISFGVSAVIGYGIVLLGCVASYIVLKLFYKTEPSKRVMNSILRRA